MLGIFLLSLVALAAADDEAQARSGYIADDLRDPIGAIHAAINAYPRLYFDLPEITIKSDACWKGSYGRGVGKPIHACPDGQDKDAGLCYPKCRDGYKGVGPVCWQRCRDGYTDTGAFCGKGGSIVSADNGACPWYDKCGLTFSKGCSKCRDHDPPYKNDGCTCRVDPHTYAKDTYGRGVGKPLGCGSDEEYDAGLCYKPCRASFNGVGPVCWQHCPAKLPHDSGAVCCENKQVCSDFIKEVSMATLTAIASALEAGMSEADEEAAQNGIIKALEAALGFVLYPCTRY